MCNVKIMKSMLVVVLKIQKVEMEHHPASVMVWWGESYEGVTQLHYYVQGLKTQAINYQNDILEKVAKSLNEQCLQE